MTSAVGGAAGCWTRVLWAFLHKSVEYAPVFHPFLHQGRRKYAYLWDFVQAGFPMPPVLSYFVRQDNRKYAYLWDFVEAGLRMPPVLWDFLHQGSRKYAYLCSFPAQATEGMLLPSSLCIVLCSFP